MFSFRRGALVTSCNLNVLNKEGPAFVRRTECCPLMIFPNWDSINWCRDLKIFLDLMEIDFEKGEAFNFLFTLFSSLYKNA